MSVVNTDFNFAAFLYIYASHLYSDRSCLCI